MPLSNDRLDKAESAQTYYIPSASQANGATDDGERWKVGATGPSHIPLNGIRGGVGETTSGSNIDPPIWPVRRSRTEPVRRKSPGPSQDLSPPARTQVNESLKQPLAPNDLGRNPAEARGEQGANPVQEQAEGKNTAISGNHGTDTAQAPTSQVQSTSARTDPKVQPMSMTVFHKQRYRFLWPEEKMKHKVFETTKFPFKWVTTIGYTSRAIVYAIHAPLGACGYTDQLAVKVISCEDDDPRKTETLMKIALMEVTNMDAIEPHHHVVSLLASYSQDNKIGILMYPVAKLNLEQFMKIISDYNNEQCEQGVYPLTTPMHPNVRILLGYFPCLIRTLELLHRQNIKHKDIKPQNILVDHFNTVLYTDFGIAKRYGTKSEALTFGPTDKTARYAAGEEPRDFDYDVFSLGCVFLEMATVILGSSVAELLEYIVKLVPTGDKMVPTSEYIRSIKEVKSWVGLLEMRHNAAKVNASLETLSQDLLGERKLRDSVVMRLPTIVKMMSPDHTLRPKFPELLEVFGPLPTESCSDCKIYSTIRKDTPRSSPGMRFQAASQPPGEIERGDRRQSLVSSSPLPPEAPLIEDVKAEAASEKRRTFPASTTTRRSTSPQPRRKMHSSPETYPESMSTDTVYSKDKRGLAADGTTPAPSSLKSFASNPGRVEPNTREIQELKTSSQPQEESLIRTPLLMEHDVAASKTAKTVGFLLPVRMPASTDGLSDSSEANTGLNGSESTENGPLQTDSTHENDAGGSSGDPISGHMSKEGPTTNLDDVSGQADPTTSTKMSFQAIFRRLSPLVGEQLDTLIDILEIDWRGDRRRVRTRLKNLPGSLILVYNEGEVEVANKKYVIGQSPLDAFGVMSSSLTYIPGKKGFFLHLPRFKRGTNFYIPPHGYVNIWNSLSKAGHYQRVLGMIRVLFVPGDWPDTELLIH